MLSAGHRMLDLSKLLQNQNKWILFLHDIRKNLDFFNEWELSPTIFSEGDFPLSGHQKWRGLLQSQWGRGAPLFFASVSNSRHGIWAWCFAVNYYHGILYIAVPTKEWHYAFAVHKYAYLQHTMHLNSPLIVSRAIYIYIGCVFSWKCLKYTINYEFVLPAI